MADACYVLLPLGESGLEQQGISRRERRAIDLGRGLPRRGHAGPVVRIAAVAVHVIRGC